MKEKEGLNFAGVAAMYVGVIVGAGFASGRETWQFFGIFGAEGFKGSVLAGCWFAALAFMVGFLAIELETDDMGKIISIVDNKKITEAIGYFMAVFLFTTIISMTAAGGSFLYQQFGIHKAAGGGIIAILVAATVLGDFKRISKFFKYVVPVLFAVVMGLCFYVILSDPEQSGKTANFQQLGMISSWYVSAPLYVAYNTLGMIPMGATTCLNAKNEKHAMAGSIIGGLLLGAMTFTLVAALQKDMAFSASLDLPMLGFASKISVPVNIVYGIVLYISIYSAATSVFYGFTTKIPDTAHKDKIILAAIFIGYLLGLVGFKNIIAYIYPVEGYFGIVVIVFITVHFFQVLVKKIINNLNR
ncbi:MAG: hypothetical protein SOR72_02490 [Hornefia sp.]|nr:hypothetical protein [Hornefia sp.]